MARILEVSIILASLAVSLQSSNTSAFREVGMENEEDNKHMGGDLCSRSLVYLEGNV